MNRKHYDMTDPNYYSEFLRGTNINNSDEKMSNITEIIGEYFIFSNIFFIVLSISSYVFGLSFFI